MPACTVPMLLGKIHRAVLTGCRLDYEGSITVDPDLLAQAGILAYQQVQVYGIESGARIETYAIAGQRGTRSVYINGAAARLFQAGDRVIICAYGHMPLVEAGRWMPRIVLLDADNHALPAPVPR